MGKEEAEALAAVAAAAQRALVVNILEAVHLPWRPPEAEGKPRKCFPFVEIKLTNAKSGFEAAHLRFQTQRLRLSEPRLRGSSVDAAFFEFGAQRDRLGENFDSGARADWNETFSWRPRSRDFWKVSMLNYYHLSYPLFFSFAVNLFSVALFRCKVESFICFAGHITLRSWCW